MIKTHKDLIACHDCGHLFDSPELAVGQQFRCRFCGNQLRARYRNWEAKTAAFTLTGIIFFVLANTLPFMALELGGQIQSSNLLSGVGSLINREEFLLAALVFVTIFLFPLLELCGLSYILLHRAMNIKSAGIVHVLRLLYLTRPWSMMEIFLLGALVASVKLGSMADIFFEPGLYAFIGLVIMLIASHMRLSRNDIWDWLAHENYYVAAEDDKTVPCDCCNAFVGKSLLAENPHCPRCNSIVRERQTGSAEKTLALLVAAIVLYIPANVLPIMISTELGDTTTDTIFSGVLYLAETDWPIAVIVFVASIIVPIVKILVLCYLLWVVRVRPVGNPKYQASLYRVTEFVGRWSMIDVFVVTLLVALVQFGLVANVEPGSAALCFAAVVVLTMLAAETFDPKLIWDAHER